MGELEGVFVGFIEGAVGELEGAAKGIRVGAGEGEDVGNWLGAALGALVTPEKIVLFPHGPEQIQVDVTCCISQVLVTFGGNPQE